MSLIDNINATGLVESSTGRSHTDPHRRQPFTYLLVDEPTDVHGASRGCNERGMWLATPGNDDLRFNLVRKF